MKTKYKIIDTKTEKGIKEAERLKKAGWIIGEIGFWTILFYKKER